MAPAAAIEYSRLRSEHEGSEIVVVSLKAQLRELQGRCAALNTSTREQVTHSSQDVTRSRSGDPPRAAEPTCQTYRTSQTGVNKHHPADRKLD